MTTEYTKNANHILIRLLTMWKLLQTELTYHKKIIAFAISFSFICFNAIWFGVHFEHNRVPLMMLIILVTTFIVFYTVEGYYSKEKRHRLAGVLPTPIIYIYLGRLLLPVFLLIIIVACLCILHTVVSFFLSNALSIPSTRQLLTLNGLVLIVGSLFLLNNETKSVSSGKYTRLLTFIGWILIYLFVLFPFYIITDFFGLFGQQTPLQGHIFGFLSSLTGGITLNLSGSVLLIISISIFLHRRSFV